MAFNDDDDDIRDYGLPPRPPSPSLISSTSQHPSDFFEVPINSNVIPFTNKKKKKKGKEEDVQYIESTDDEDEIIEVKQEVKEESIDTVDILSGEEEVDDDEIQVVEVTQLDKADRRALWRNKDRSKWKEKQRTKGKNGNKTGKREASSSNEPRQGTSSSFTNGHPASGGGAPQNQSQGSGTNPPAPTGQGQAESNAPQSGEPVQHPGVAAGSTIPPPRSGPDPVQQPQPPMHQPQQQTVPPNQNATTNTPRDDGANPGPVPVAQSIHNNTIMVHVDVGKEVVFQLPGQLPWSIMAVRTDKSKREPSPPSSPNQKDSKDCQTGPSVLNGKFFTRKRADDVTDPQNQSPKKTPSTIRPNVTSSQGPIASGSGTNTRNGNKSHGANTPRRDSNQRDRSRSPHPPRSQSRRRSSDDNDKSRSERRRRSRSRSRSPSRDTVRRPENRPNNEPRRTNHNEGVPLIRCPNDAILVIRSCNICKTKFGSRREGVEHQTTIHKKKYCPVCFKLLPKRGNAWKNHLVERHGVTTDEDDVEMAKCRFCKKEYAFEGLYQHVGRSHFVKIENRGKKKKVTNDPPPPSSPSSSNSSSPYDYPCNSPSPPPTRRTNPTIPPQNPPKTATTTNSQTSRNMTATHGGSGESRSNIAAATPSGPASKTRGHATPSTSQSNNFSTRASRVGYIIPRITPQAAATHAAAVVQPSAQSDTRREATAAGAYRANGLEPAVTAVHVGRLNVLFSQHKGIPDKPVIEMIANDLGVAKEAINKWFTTRHRQVCQHNARLFHKKKK